MSLGLMAMIMWRSLFYGFCLALGATMMTPALAADIECSNPHHRVDEAICANPTLKELASQLTVAYETALARASSQDRELEEDQRNWLGERDDSYVMSWAEEWRQGKAWRRIVDEALARFYKSRILFLDNVDNPASIRESPIAQKLLMAVRSLPAGTQNILSVLTSTGVVTTAHQLPKLPAPPSQNLRAALKQYLSFGGLTKVYLPSARLGGVFAGWPNVCRPWLTFQERAGVTVPTPPTNLLVECIDFPQSNSYLALIDGFPVAIFETDVFNSHSTYLYWQRWRGDKWGPLMSMEIRFSWTLRISDRDHCDVMSHLACGLVSEAAFDAAALGAVNTYIRDPWSAQHQSWMTASDMTHFSSMQAHIHIPEADCSMEISQNGTVGFWFPARIGRKLVVGCISPGQSGVDQEEGFDVAFWADGANNHTVRLSDDYVTAQNGRVLALAIMPSGVTPYPCCYPQGTAN